MNAGLFSQSAGNGPPVVLVHAGVADGRMWGPQVEALADRYRVVVPDLRGFGRSPIPDRPFAHAADLEALVSDLGIERAAWVGCSQGGTAALDLALAAPELVAALVLVDCAPSGYQITDPVTRAGWAAAGEAYEAHDFRRAAEIEMEMWLVGRDRDIKVVPRAMRELVVTMLLDSYEHGEGEEIDPERLAVDCLEETPVPTLVVSGAHDQPDFRDAAAMMAARVPNAAHEVVGGAAHLPSLERPVAFNELLAAFLEQQRA
ncbi:MAG: alpha/beta fold hydrolase [Acidimicrobiia bacterium]|nr:alpha/beta fold hydrolase [Acidimicrobiia bacterium]